MLGPKNFDQKRGKGRIVGKEKMGAKMIAITKIGLRQLIIATMAIAAINDMPLVLPAISVSDGYLFRTTNAAIAVIAISTTAIIIAAINESAL